MFASFHSTGRGLQLYVASYAIIVNATTIVSDTSFYYAVLFMQRSLNLQTTKIDNKLSDSHKRKRTKRFSM